jgi:hypothetical protein
MAGSDEDHDRSRRPGADGWGWSSTGRVLSGRTIERSGDIMCGLHRAQGDEEHRFLGLTSKPRATVSPGLTSKPVASGFPVWASKPVAMIWLLGHKITVTVFWCGPQNQVVYGLLIVPQN